MRFLPLTRRELTSQRNEVALLLLLLVQTEMFLNGRYYQIYLCIKV